MTAEFGDKFIITPFRLDDQLGALPWVMDLQYRHALWDDRCQKRNQKGGICKRKAHFLYLPVKGGQFILCRPHVYYMLGNVPELKRYREWQKRVEFREADHER